MNTGFERPALCPNCGGEGSREVSAPQRDDPYYAKVVKCEMCGGCGYIDEANFDPARDPCNWPENIR